MCRIPTSSSLCNRKLPIVSFIVFAPLVSTRGSQTHAIPWFHAVLHVRVIARGRSPFGRFSAARSRSRFPPAAREAGWVRKCSRRSRACVFGDFASAPDRNYLAHPGRRDLSLLLPSSHRI